MRIRKKVLSVFLSLVLVAGLCPGTAFGGGVAEVTSAKNTATINRVAAAARTAGGSVSDFLSVVNSQKNGAGMSKYSNHARAWCADFVVWCARQAGVSANVIPSTSFCPTMANWFKNRGQWHSYTYKAKAGDLIFYAYNNNDRPRHVGVVTAVSGGKVYTKEGNVNGGAGVVGSFSNRRVGSNGFPGWYIIGYASPSYVSATPTAKAPTIKPHDVLGGKKIELYDNEGGATIHYTIDGKTDPTTSSTVYNGNWINDTWTTMGVRAIAAKKGKNPSSPRDASKTVYTGLTANPRVVQSDTAAGATIELKSDTKAATIFYTLDGTEPKFDMSSGKSNAKKYTGTFNLTKNCTVKALAVASGMRASSVVTQEIVCVAPNVPTPKAESDKIAQGDAVKVTWDRDASAASYTATLYQGDRVVDTQTTSAPEAVFVLSEAGTYTVGVKATNAIGSSAESAKVTVEAMAPLTVRFMSNYTDENGQEVSRVDNEQKVKYGYDAASPDNAPKRRGYTFAGWSGNYNGVKKDTDVISKWQINEYKVKFYAADGKTLLSQQDVQFNQAATAPDPGAAPTGKMFSGWAVADAREDDSARDFTKVDSDLTLRAVFAWADEELPVVAEITKAERTASGNYTVHVKLTNHPTDITTALLRVALKTSGDKLVQTSRETIEIGTDGTIEKDVVLKYNGDNVATVAEVEVVGLDGNYRTGGAYSKAVKREVVSMDNFYFTDWSEWSTEKPAASDTVEVEEATQYRSRDKQFAESTATSMSGWERSGKAPVTTYGNWSGNKTTTSKPATSDTLQIVGQSTKYTYYRWCNWYDNCRNQDSVAYGSDRHYHEVTLNSPMAACANKFADKGGKAWDLHGPYGSCSHRRAGQSYWWTKSIVTTYTYQTRSKTVTYEYAKWGDWGDWGFAEITGSTDREVQTQKVYRYRTKQPGNIQGTEDATGTKQTISGKLSTGTDLAGKEATIMVYNVTNSDPNEDQVQYIGQTTIGTDNAYSFSFIPRQDPSVESGDFIVALGVKGSTGLVNVATVKAPRAQYTVKYQYEKPDGTIAVVSEQKVSAGEDAQVPEAPVLEGRQFLGWSRSASGVDRDLVVNALFAERTCTVAWVDYEAQDVLLQTVPYGATLTAPTERAEVEGYTFKGWDALMDGTTQATDNMVIKAVYEPVKHTVMFVNYDGSAFKTVQVEHGKAASLPETNPTAPGMEFVSWGTTSQTPWWSVTKDLVVKPLFAYEGTVSSPYSSVEIASGYVGAKGTKVYLEAPTDGSTIYYTTDGTDPVVPEVASFAATSADDEEVELPSENDLDKEPGVTYAYDPEEGITVTQEVTIRAMACADGMNDSSIAEIPVKVTATNDLSHAEIYLTSAPYYYGEAVEPGIMVSFGDDLLVYDEDFTVTYSNNNGIGKAKAVVKGKGAYTGQQTLEFDITAPPTEGDDGSSEGDGSGTTNPSNPSNPSNPGTSSSKPDTGTKPGGNTGTNPGASGTSKPSGSQTNPAPGTPGASDGTAAPAAPISLAGAKVSAAFVKKNAKPAITVKVNGKTLQAGTDYTVSCGKVKKVGAKVKVTVKGKGAYTGKKTVKVKVAKGSNPMTVKAAKKVQTVKLAKVKKGACIINRPLVVKKAAGKVTYKKASKDKAVKKFKVNAKTGKITVPKGTKKGTYTLKVKVTAKGNASYKAGSKTVTVKVRVK